MAIRWSMCVSTVPPPIPAPCAHTTRVSPSAQALTPQAAQTRNRRGEPVALLDAQLTSPFHPRFALGRRGDHRKDRVFVDHARRALRRHGHASQRAGAHAQIRHRLAAACAAFSKRKSAPISAGVVKACAGWVHQHILDGNVRTGADQRRRCGEGRGARDRPAPQHRRPCSTASPRTVILRSRRSLARRHLGPEMAHHGFGVVARGLRLDHDRLALQSSARPAGSRFHLRRRDRRAIVIGVDWQTRQGVSGSRRPSPAPPRPSASGVKHAAHGRRDRRLVAGQPPPKRAGDRPSSAARPYRHCRNPAARPARPARRNRRRQRARPSPCAVICAPICPQARAAVASTSALRASPATWFPRSPAHRRSARGGRSTCRRARGGPLKEPVLRRSGVGP